MKKGSLSWGCPPAGLRGLSGVFPLPFLRRRAVVPPLPLLPVSASSSGILEEASPSKSFLSVYFFSDARLCHGRGKDHRILLKDIWGFEVCMPKGSFEVAPSPQISFIITTFGWANTKIEMPVCLEHL